MLSAKSAVAVRRECAPAGGREHSFFFGFDWANKEAINYICAEGSYIMWFYELRFLGPRRSRHEKRRCLTDRRALAEIEAAGTTTTRLL